MPADVPDAGEPAPDEALGHETPDTEPASEPDENADAVAAEHDPPRSGRKRFAVAAVVALALILALAVGYLKWLDGADRENRSAAEQSVRAATESTIAILSYRPDTVDQELSAAADRLTADFRQQYTQLVHDVVAPGAKQQHITAVATVPAAASVTATGKQAVVLVFVDQTTTIGTDPPTQSTSSVRVTLDKIGNRWLISQFDPV